MLSADFEIVRSYVEANATWAAGLATSMFAMTLAALGLLNQSRKDDIALWLMGVQSEEDWSRSFCSLFDALFGARHLSWTCFLRSAAASLVSVVVIWTLMGSAGTFVFRVRAELSLGAVLLLALAINVLADYVSLLETRWLLGQMRRLQAWWQQVAALLLDLLLSAAIIWAAIVIYLLTPLSSPAGRSESFPEVVGLFSTLSVFFYSTFLTSLWTWAYILSTWILRIFTRLRLAHWLDVERRPVMMLALVLAGGVFAGSLLVAIPLQKDADGVAPVDRMLCRLSAGPVCFDVAALAGTAEATWTLLQTTCGPGLVEPGAPVKCREWLAEAFARDPTSTQAVADLSCRAGTLTSCGMAFSLRPEGFDCATSQATQATDPVCRALAKLSRSIGEPTTSPITDVEVMRLKRGLDLGSQIRDMAEQLRARRPQASLSRHGAKTAQRRMAASWACAA